MHSFPPSFNHEISSPFFLFLFLLTQLLGTYRHRGAERRRGWNLCCRQWESPYGLFLFYTLLLHPSPSRPLSLKSFRPSLERGEGGWRCEGTKKKNGFLLACHYRGSPYRVSSAGIGRTDKFAAAKENCGGNPCLLISVFLSVSGRWKRRRRGWRNGRKKGTLSLLRKPPLLLLGTPFLSFSPPPCFPSSCPLSLLVFKP